MRRLLTNRVTIQKQTITQAADASPAGSLATRKANVRCRIMPVSLQKRAVQGREGEVITHKVLFGPGEVIEFTDRLFELATNRTYKVMTVEKIQRVGREHHVTVEAVKL